MHVSCSYDMSYVIITFDIREFRIMSSYVIWKKHKNNRDNLIGHLFMLVFFKLTLLKLPEAIEARAELMMSGKKKRKKSSMIHLASLSVFPIINIIYT